MLKKRSAKKLVLARETIRVLDDRDLERGHGATGPISILCPTVKCAPTAICGATWVDCESQVQCPMPSLISCRGCPTMFTC